MSSFGVWKIWSPTPWGSPLHLNELDETARITLGSFDFYMLVYISWFLHLPFLWNLENTPKYLWLYLLNPEMKQEEITKISQCPSSVNVPLWLHQEAGRSPQLRSLPPMADTLQTRKPTIQKYHHKRVLSHLNNKLHISSYFFKNDSLLTCNYDSTLHWLLSFIFFLPLTNAWSFL